MINKEYINSVRVRSRVLNYPGLNWNKYKQIRLEK